MTHTTALPVHLTDPYDSPLPVRADCDVCRALVRARELAQARGDLSAVTDTSIEIRNHHS